MTEKTDRLHRIAVETAEKGEGHIWECCFALSELVGLYEHGKIKSLAEDMNLSPRQVYRRGSAGAEYNALRSALGVPLPILRFSFYVEMGLLRRRYEFSPEYALAQLQTTKETGVSVDRMRQLIEEEMEPTIARLEGKIQSASGILADGIANRDWRLAERAHRILGA